MTAQHSTPTVRPVAIVYAVELKGQPARVTVHRDSFGLTGHGYECNCKDFKLWGECAHTDAVKAQRAAEGRK
jgi:hypothetical protein